jgi:drug/metabolite transporter (DMT)-like permease
VPDRFGGVSGGVAIGLLLAAVCALGTNVGWLIKHRGAQQSARMRHRQPLRSVRNLFGSRWFVAGLVIASGAGLLHIAALALAPISIVQAVMAGGLVMLAILAEPIFGWRVTGRQWSGVILSAVGLSLLAVTLPQIAGAHNDFSPTAMTVFEAAGLLASLVLLLSPRIRRLGAHDGVLIGAAAGVFFGVADIAVKALLGVVHDGILAVLLSPWLLVALAAGAVAQYVSARSLQTGDGVSVTALTGVAVNVVNIAGGIIVFGDPLARGLAGTLAEAAAFALICAAAFLTPVPAAPAGKPGPAVAA